MIVLLNSIELDFEKQGSASVVTGTKVLKTSLFRER